LNKASQPISAARSARRGVGGEEGIAGAGGEDHHPALLHVPQRAAADIGLGDLAIGIADWTRVSTPIRSSAFCTASAFITVASMPI
jgi:hypothetical protein